MRFIYESDASAMETGAQLRSHVEWIRSLGLDPAKILPRYGIARTKTGYELHVTEKYQKDGHDVFDHLRDDIGSFPVVIDLGDAPLPDFIAKAVTE
jgi:hypothetical protein